MNLLLRGGLLIALLASMTASAQRRKEDAPIPYDDPSDDDDRRRDLPRRSEQSREPVRETDVEREDREISLASDDDPNIGIGFEVTLGLNLLDSSRAQGVEPMFMGGIRVTWEWARTLLTDEFWREVFFADVLWLGSSAWGPSGFGGTKEIFDSVNYHHFALAQGFAIPLGKTPAAFFAQAGIGFSYQTSQIYIQGGEPTSIAAARLLIQYGLGLRFRVHLVSEESFREHGYVGIPALAFRIELTRFRRAYMDDTYIGVSGGIIF